MATQAVVTKRSKSRKVALQYLRTRGLSGGGSSSENWRAGLDSDCSEADLLYGQLGLEDGLRELEEEDRTVVSQLYDVIKEHKKRKSDYCNLFAFLTFTALYMIVLYLQQEVALVYQMTVGNSGFLPQDGGGNPLASYTFPSEVYEYLNQTFVQTLWADPVCGDGVCDRPIEFNGFGRFGCTPDCGPMDTIPVTFRFDTSFKTAQDQADSEWNVCMTFPDHLCWFDTNQKFADQSGSFETTLNLPNGTWDVRLAAPNNGVSGKATTVVTIAEGFVDDVTLTEWGTCVAETNSDLLRCRSICAKGAECAADACLEIGEDKIGGLFIDCISLCNANVTAMDPYYNRTCLQIIVASNNSASNSFFKASGRTCSLDPAYIIAHHGEVTIPTPGPTGSFPGGEPHGALPDGGRRRLSSSSPPARRRLSQALNSTQLYWNQFGNTDAQRFSTLATALSRAMYTWVIDTCLAKYSMSPPKTGPQMLGFFCAYFGGPANLPGCSYRDPATNVTLTSADVDALHAVLAARYGPGSSYSISQTEQDRFIAILKNALIATGGRLNSVEVWNLDDRLHETDLEVVAVGDSNMCNFVNVVLPWQQNVHHSTNLTVGDSIQFVWADDLPHAIKAPNLLDKDDIFNGFGTGRRIISRQTHCTPENAGAEENGSFTKDPVPCIVPADGPSSSFSLTQVFTEPGIYKYVDARFGASMTGTVYVSTLTTLSAVATSADRRECSPGCYLHYLANGRCDSSFNCNTVECGFDGGDCSCPDPSTELASFGSNTKSTSNNLCECPFGQIRGDDASCCQAEDIGEDLRAVFNVVIEDIPEPPVDTKNFTRVRYTTNHNRVVAGLSLRQTRYSGEACKQKRFLNLFNWCITGESTKPFGVDPVFVPTSSLFNPDLLPQVGKYYAPDEISPKGIPHGFFAEKIGDSTDYPVFFDINLDQRGATDRLQYLKDGLFLDNATNVLHLQLVTYNGDTHHFVNGELRFTFQKAGKIAINKVLTAITVEPYREPADYVKMALEIILAFCIFFTLFREIMEAVQIKKHYGSFRPYFRIAWNYIDLISLALLVTAVVMRILYVTHFARKFHAKPRYEVYETLTPPARYFGLKKDGSELGQFLDLLDSIHYLNSYNAIYAGLNGINIFFMILRILKHMHFQPRMGVLTRTLVEAGPDILNFFILWTIVFLGYAFMGFLVFGSSVDYFRNLGWSITSCFLLMLGDTVSEYNLMELQGWEFAAGQFFFWTFNWFMVFIVMNFLIAIAVDAFVDVKEKIENAPTMPEEILEYAYWQFQSIVKRRLSQRQVAKQLKAWKKPVVLRDGKPKILEDTHDDADLCEEVQFLKLDGKQYDLETLQNILERRARSHGLVVAKADASAVAKQVMLEYGEAVKVTRKKATKTKKYQELLELKAAVRNLDANVELRLKDFQDQLYGRLDAFQADLAKSGLSKSVIHEEHERGDDRHDADDAVARQNERTRHE